MLSHITHILPYVASYGGRGGAAPYYYLEVHDNPIYGNFHKPLLAGSGGGVSKVCIIVIS